MTFDELMSETRRRRGNLDTLVREHLFAGVPFVFRDHPADYELLRRHLSHELNVQTSSVTIVGSGRLGYSLNPSHPGQPILDTSDIDILIADEKKLFDRFWQLMLKWRYPWHMKHWSEAEREWGTRHLENFIAGYSDPHGIRFARLGFRRYRTQLLDFSHSVVFRVQVYGKLSGTGWPRVQRTSISLMVVRHKVSCVRLALIEPEILAATSGGHVKFDSFPQSIIWFRDRYQAGELELKPPFQRQPVWVAKQKCSLIESILLDLPVPEVYIQEALVETNGVLTPRYYVVDGQQRIRTVLQFLGVERTESELDWNRFSLSKLPEESLYKDVNFDGLSVERRTSFLQYRFAGRILQGADDPAVWDMFRQLNQFLTKLNDQELRNATYTGPFIRVATTLAEKKFWLERGLILPAQIRRMKDIEFASELLIGVIHGPQGG